MPSLRPLLLIALSLTIVPATLAQIPNATDTTMTPQPGGHNYLHSPVETVNPANGSVSIRIPVRMVQGRQTTIPFSFAYDSNGARYFGPAPQGGGPQYITTYNNLNTLDGWSYSYPVMSFAGGSWTIPGSLDNNITCYGSTNYVFQDAEGNRHNLGLSVSANVASPDGIDNCDQGIQQDGEFPTGSEGPLTATTSIPDSNTRTFPGVTIADGYGKAYVLPGGNPFQTGGLTTLATSIVDRNGNTVTISRQTGNYPAVTYTDTIGRTALSVSGMGASPDTVTLAGLSSPYKVYWGTASVTSFTNSVNNFPDENQNCPTTWGSTGTAGVLSSIVLPDGRQFTFSYDPTYGMISKIVYPSGGYVRYVWGLNSYAEAGVWSYQANGTIYGWGCQYGFPAVTDRYVSYDGSTEVLHQHFSYYTNWPSNTSLNWNYKTTTVTTTDLIRNTTFTTVYTYSPMGTEYVPNCGSCYFTQQIPTEKTIQYEDTGGATLRTVTKSWEDIRALQSEQIQLDTGQSSLKVYCYSSSEHVTEVDEYDLGTGTPSGNCASVPSGTQSGSLLRKTTTTYDTNYAYLPTTVITYDGAGNRVAETDSSYDASGNLLTQTKDCFALPTGTACPQGNSTTQYTYDSHGQILTVVDPKNNTTSYSYTDNYGSCGGNAPPTSPSDAYLTQVTYPQTNGVNHVVHYCYDYSRGLLLSSTDQNGQVTTYQYSDALDRLTQTNYPDGGQTTYSYNDSPPNPTLTTRTLITSGVYKTTVQTMDGFGQTIESQITSDTDGTDSTYTTYDGLGRVYKAYNPTRCNPPTTNCGESTWGYKTYTYDALGRTTQVTDQDGSQISTVYSGNETTVTDEALHQRSSFTDGLGRLIEVDEPGATDATPGTGSVTFYASGGIQTYTFNPCAGNQYPAPQYCPQTEYDNGTIALTVEGQTFTINYTGSASSDASAMANAINQNSSYVFARPSGSTVDLVARTPGASTNYSLSCCTYTWNTGSYNGTSFFSGPNDTASASGSSLTGGTGANASPAVTQYTYDTLNDLLSVTQQGGADSSQWRVRTFNYDSLTRLVCSSNPENSSAQCPSAPNGSYTPGTVGYTYDPDGNVATKTDARGITTTYSYDVLNRLYEKQYSDGTATVTYGYDGVAGPGNCAPGLGSGNETIGERTSMCDAAGKESWSYAIVTGVGPQTTNQRTTNGITKTTTSQDNLYGSLASLTYPSTRVISYVANGAALPFSAADSSVNYASAAHYTAAGALAYLQTGPNLYTTSIYNSRLQPCWIYANTGSALSWTGTSCSSTTTAGNVMDLKYNFNFGQSDNGNVMGVTNDHDSTRSQVFTYDTLNRLQTAGTASTSGTNCWDEQYAYDAWANLTSLSPQASYSTSCAYENPFTYTMNVKNQVTSPTGFSYDASGNVTDSTAYAYNAESEMTSAAGYTYVYDGDGRRVEKIFGGSVVKIYWYGGGSAALDETDGTGSTTNSNFSEYIFFAGARIARRDASGDVFYYVADHLGSARAIAEVVSGQNTATLCYDADFYPFGGEMMHTATCSQNYKFEGKERDAESGLDDFGARFYNSGSVLASTPFGRFATADWSAIPAPVPYANLSNPQTLNLYAMVSDNPETFADLDGHCGIEGDEVYPCTGWGGARGAGENCSIDRGGSAPRQLAGGTDAIDPCAGNCDETNTGTSPEEDQETANQQAQQAANDQLSKKGLEFIARHEGIKGKKGGRYYTYLDIYGNPTIGYGHLIRKGENYSKGITKAQALALLKSDAQTAVSFVNKRLSASVTQTQFDALTDVAFNSERAAGKLINRVNSSETIGPADFVNTLPHGYNSPPGLINRREDEATLFLRGDYQ